MFIDDVKTVNITANVVEDESPLSAEEIENLAKVVDREALEILLSTFKENVEILSVGVNQSHKDAASALRSYLKAFAAAMPLTTENEAREAKVEELVEIEHQAQIKVDEAKQSELSLLAEIESLQNLINKVRESGAESTVADDAEKCISLGREGLGGAIAEIDAAQSDFDFLLNYQEFVNKAPNELQKDLKIFASEMLDIVENNKIDVTTLPYDQAVLMLALRRKQVFRDTAAEQANGMDQKEVEILLKQQKEDIERLAEETLAVELKRLELEKSVEQEEKVTLFVTLIIRAD